MTSMTAKKAALNLLKDAAIVYINQEIDSVYDDWLKTWGFDREIPFFRDMKEMSKKALEDTISNIQNYPFDLWSSDEFKNTFTKYATKDSITSYQKQMIDLLGTRSNLSVFNYPYSIAENMYTYMVRHIVNKLNEQYDLAGD